MAPLENAGGTVSIGKTGCALLRVAGLYGISIDVLVNCVKLYEVLEVNEDCVFSRRHAPHLLHRYMLSQRRFSTSYQ